LVWSGLRAGLLFVAGLLVYLQFTVGQHAGDTAYAEQLTWVSGTLAWSYASKGQQTSNIPSLSSSKACVD
jgi:hypothetical protein